ncbi:7746_t:CDS:2, partial [Funneliformis caledonium]
MNTHSIQNERYTQIKHLKDLESHGYTPKNTVTKHELNVVKNTLVDKINDLKNYEIKQVRNEVRMIRNEIRMIRNEVGIIRDEVDKIRDEIGKIKNFILRSVFGTAGIVLSTSGIIL